MGKKFPMKEGTLFGLLGAVADFLYYSIFFSVWEVVFHFFTVAAGMLDYGAEKRYNITK